MTELADLKTQRRQIKAQITRCQTAVNSFNERNNPLELEARLNSLTEIFKEYNKVQSKIEIAEYESTVDEDALETEHNKERDLVETKYHQIIGAIKTILNSNKQNNPTQDTGTVINITKNGPEIPETVLKPVELPSFSGKHSEWTAFFELYKALVHENANLTNIRKFYYLRDCLKDEALRSIEPLAVTSANYDSAIELLKNRYDNKRLIIQEHVANILNIQAIIKSSAEEIRDLVDIINNNLAALKVLNQPVDYWDTLLIGVLVEKLDYATRKEWQIALGKEPPTYKQFIDFLERRYQILHELERVNQKGKEKNNTKLVQTPTSKTKFERNQQKHSRIANAIFRISCPICKEAHNPHQCPRFLNMTTAERLQTCHDAKLCLNCLRSNHVIKECKSTASCRTCNKRHHTLLHQDDAGSSANAVHSKNQVLLSTARVFIYGKNGKIEQCRALLDVGSQVNLITSDLCNKLGIVPTNKTEFITGISVATKPTLGRTLVTMKSRVSEFTTNLDCLVMPKITLPQPAKTISKNQIKFPNNVVLADPDFNISSEIDLLIGAQLYWQLLIGSPIQVVKEQPHFQRTKLGYIVGGQISLHKPNSRSISCHVISPDSGLDNTLSRFFMQEGVTGRTEFTQEEINCERHFVENTVRTPNGRFQVKLPFKSTINWAQTKDAALKQFFNLEMRLNNNHKLKEAYREFMNEYRTLGHMRPVTERELDFPNAFYLPHHAVFKQTPEGSKIRVVFNASFKSSNGISLNDKLMTGPTIQEDLFSILCRFRTHQVALSADITKMYRMILIEPKDTNFQRIFWRDNPNSPVEIYNLTTLTYGTTCAPFIAVRALHELANENEHKNPIASTVIKRDFYMDDLLTGADSVEDALAIKRNVSNILKSGGFEITKWASNSFENTQGPDVDFHKTENTKILGLHWNCSNDLLRYNINIPTINTRNSITKRLILSTIARIFDPRGLINPIIVKAKILLQDLWNLKLDWDEPVPFEIKNTYVEFVKTLIHLKDYGIPRKVIPIAAVTAIEIHSFADASSKAYGAVIYIRIIHNDGTFSVNLLCAKSRVAPIKPITLPRLELNAAVLSVQLASKVIGILNLNVAKRYFWTDSTIVLSWLNSQPETWKKYIANRVAQIQDKSSFNEWRHVRPADNPADIVSRGSTPNKLRQNDLWWHGPHWLKGKSEQWPTLVETTNSDWNEFYREPRSTPVVNVLQQEEELPIISKFASFRKLQRVFAYCLRFIEGTRNKTRAKTITLTVDELESSAARIIKHVQQRAFHDEIQAIKKNNKRQKFAALDPFFDENGLLRVGGRLKNAPINSRPIHPLSHDPNDLAALTPGHFLIGEALTTPIERNLQEININRLSRWQRIEQLQQHFWSRWHREYLHQLQQRPKGQRTVVDNITIGQLVILVEDNLPPLQWRLGRVIDVHPGRDGVVRVISVKTSSGIVKRSITKVCVVPTEPEV